MRPAAHVFIGYKPRTRMQALFFEIIMLARDGKIYKVKRNREMGNFSSELMDEGQKRGGIYA